MSLPAKRAVSRQRASATAILGTRCHCWCRAFVFVAEIDAALGQVVGSHFHGNSIAGEDADPVFLHPAGGIGQSFVPIVELYSEAGVREQLLYGAVELDQVFFGQTDLLDKGTGAPRRPRINIPPSPQTARKFTAETRPR